MKKLDLGQTAHLLGNLGVIVGILLLVYELNQNRNMMAAQTRNSIAQATAVLIQNESMNAAHLEIVNRGIAGEELTPLEQEQFELNWLAYFMLWENTDYQYRVGLYDDIEYESTQKTWVRLLSQPGIQELWCSSRGRGERSEAFVAEIDRLLGEATC